MGTLTAGHLRQFDGAYDGVHDMAKLLRESGIKISSVTVSPDPDIEDDEIELKGGYSVQVGSSEAYFILTHTNGGGTKYFETRETPGDVLADYLREVA